MEAVSRRRARIVLAQVVLDSSATIAWFMPDEQGSQQLLQHVAAEGAVVPSIWPLEIGNAFLLAFRRGRITADHRARALDQLASLPIEYDSETLTYAWTATLELADRFRLTLYDACYVELARRRGLPIASLDRNLRAAAQALRVPIFGA
jgi:predicted nucleic acid-binding protein